MTTKHFKYLSPYRSVFILTLLFFINMSAYADTLYYNIAHQINSSKLLDWAATQGANSVEADFQFKGSDTTIVRHGSPCDCSASPRAELCKATRSLVGLNIFTQCNAQDTVNTFLNALATKQFALLIVDTKAGSITPKNSTAWTKAGASMIATLNAQLFAKGYTGKVIVGVDELKYFAYLQGAAAAAQQSPYASRIYFSIDQEPNATAVIAKLQTLNTKNIAYGVGVSSFVPKTYYPSIGAASAFVNRGVLALAYIWTIDSTSSMLNYLNAGARGVMTNNPSQLNGVYTSYFKANPGSRYATPSDPSL